MRRRRRRLGQREPRLHWPLGALLTIVGFAALLLHGYAAHDIGHSDNARDATGARARLESAGGLMDISSDVVKSTRPRPRTVALMFDDGPDPTWTPAVLDVLRSHGVRATFFVVGARVLEHPALTRRW